MGEQVTTPGADSPLDRALTVTKFKSVTDRAPKTFHRTLRQLKDRIVQRTAPTKEQLPLLKVGAFGTKQSENGAIRHDENLISVDGVEGDYDAGKVSIDEVISRLEAADLAALVYTTPSYTADVPRWRVLCPLSETHRPPARRAFAERLNCALGGILARESFVLSQTYYYGFIENTGDHRVVLVDGRYLDCATDLDAITIARSASSGKPETAGPTKGRDNSRSGRALALAGKIRRRAGTLDDYRDALTADPELSAWAADDRQVARAWQKAGGDGASDMDGFPMTEDGIALAFAKRYRDRLLYDHPAERWYRWADTHWQVEETQLAFAWCRDTCRDMARVNADGPGVRALARAATAAAVERFARADRAFAVTSDGWDTDPWLLGTPGGTVDLRTGKRSPARRDDRITRLVAATPADRFDESIDCPRWMAFLDEATGGDTALVRFLQQWSGYCLTGSVKEHAMLFVYGLGGNGKSVFIDTLAGALKDYAQTAAMDTFTDAGAGRHLTFLAMLKGARMVTASETDEGKPWAEVRIKQLTGGDPVTANYMRRDPFTFEPTFKLTIVGNHKPALHAVDDALKRRINIVPFLHKPARPDPDLKTQLRAEWAGILAWAIEGCLDWQRNGLIRPDSVKAATAEYFETQDLMAQWLDECCEQGSSFAATTPALMADWKVFAESRGSRADVIPRTFSDRLATRGFPRVKNTHGIRGRGFAGLQLREREGD